MIENQYKDSKLEKNAEKQVEKQDDFRRQWTDEGNAIEIKKKES